MTWPLQCFSLAGIWIRLLTHLPLSLKLAFHTRKSHFIHTNLNRILYTPIGLGLYSSRVTIGQVIVASNFRRVIDLSQALTRQLVEPTSTYKDDLGYRSPVDSICILGGLLLLLVFHGATTTDMAFPTAGFQCTITRCLRHTSITDSIENKYSARSRSNVGRTIDSTGIS